MGDAQGQTKQAWIVDYTDQHGKRHIETYQRKKDADAQEARVLVDIGKGVHVAPSDSITVSAAAQQWMARVKAEGRERATLQGYEQHVRDYIVPHIGRVKLAKLTALMVEGFRDKLLAEVEQRSGSFGGQASAVAGNGAQGAGESTSLLKSAKVAHVAADVTNAGSKRGATNSSTRDWTSRRPAKSSGCLRRQPRNANARSCSPRRSPCCGPPSCADCGGATLI